MFKALSVLATLNSILITCATKINTKGSSLEFGLLIEKSQKLYRGWIWT